MQATQPTPVDVTSYAVHELKGALSSILAKVQTGTEAVITSHRKPIAKIVPFEAIDDRQKPPAQDPNYRDTSQLPQIPGVVWSTQKMRLDLDFKPIKMRGEGPTGSEIIAMHRSGLTY